MAKESGAIHAGHPHVGNHHVEAAGLAGLQGGFAAHRKLQVPTLPIRVQHTSNAVENLAFIIHEQDAFHADTVLAATALPSLGRRMIKVVPFPSSVSK
jgi:hypothetical protein